MLRGLAYFLLFVLLLAAAGGGYFYYWKSHQPQESVFDPIIVSVARNEGVDPFLVRALVWRESKFNPLTHGSHDERGLMQVEPEVGEAWAKANKIEDFNSEKLYDAETNIRVGTWYLNQSLKRYYQTDDPPTFALAEYNAGHRNAEKWVDPLSPLSHTAFLDRITFPNTRKYVETILTKRDEYSRAFADNRWYKPDVDMPSASAPPGLAPATKSP